MAVFREATSEELYETEVTRDEVFKLIDKAQIIKTLLPDGIHSSKSFLKNEKENLSV